MKRRAICFVTVLALCLGLCPTWVLGWEADALDSADTAMVAADDIPSNRYAVDMDTTITGPYTIWEPTVFDTCGHTYTATNAAVLDVMDIVYLTTGIIKSEKDAGIKVQSGGFLCVRNAGIEVIGETVGLEFFSGATAQLSGGKFTGQDAAIRTEDSDFGALLKPGCAYFEENGNPIPLEDVAGKKTVVVKECTAHRYTYEKDTGVTHNGVCDYCGETITSEGCKFNFDKNGQAACEFCGREVEVSIAVDEEPLVYNGAERPQSVSVAVTMDGETIPEEANIYRWDHTPCVNAGETAVVTVTVGDAAYESNTYTKLFPVVQDAPEITWKNDGPLVFDYEADKAGLLSKIETDLRQNLEIKVKAGADLSGDILYSYRDKDGDAGFTDGLPTDAGTYEVMASLPETQNYHAASSELIDLIIKKVDPMIMEPVAVKPVYDGTVQNLVTSGTAPDDAEIQFAESENGPWSKDIPTGINAGSYEVWYKVVDEANNYNIVGPLLIDGVEILRKEITPVVELEYHATVYDGGYKEPKVTVRDPEDWKELPSTEYIVTYSSNQNVGTATVTVTDQENGNYGILPDKGVSVNFVITAADQAALTITGQPNTVVYGDVFTLGTSGGSGSGAVTWKITDGDGIAEIGEKSGQVTVKGVGTVTVLATKSEGDSANHKDATAQWTFTAGKRPVTAVVTADNKTYDGKVTAPVTAVVEQGVVFSDKIEIDVTGTFSDANAGTNKTVTVDTAGAVITVNGAPIVNNDTAPNETYIVTIPKTTTADIDKVVSRIVTPPEPKETLAYNKDAQELLSKGAVPNNTKNIQVEYALSKDGPYSTDFHFPKATDAGRYEVWYRAQESANYTAIPPAMVEVTINPKVITPAVTLNEYSYTYDGNEKKPTVTVKDGNDVIPASEYTVTYSNNVNVGTNATVTVTDNAGGNYTVSETSVTFTITTGGSAVLTGTPRANDLTYNGQPQDLVSVGSATGGEVWYSLTEAEDSYSPTIPQETNAGQYTVYYKVKGDNNHTDTAPSRVFVTIQPKTVSSPVIKLTDEDASGLYSVTYSGQKQEPGVASVADGDVAIDSGEYTVTYSNNINAGTATVHIIDSSGGNYNVTGSRTFEITRAPAKFKDGNEPKAKENLTYNAKAQTLITAGIPEGGTAVYSLGDKNGPYLESLPTGTECGSYEVWAKVLGDGNHKDSDPIEIENVEIGVNEVSDPTVELSSSSFRYNGSEQKPTVTVKDDKGDVIPANEYTVTYGDNLDDTIKAGTYQIKIASKADGNYSFTAERTVTILAADQTPLTITGKPGIVYYGDTIHLSAVGGSGTGAVAWSITTEGDIAAIDADTGLLTIKGANGSVTVKAVRASDTGNYAPVEDTWTFYADPKPVAAVVTAANKPYDKNAKAALSVSVPVAGIKIEVKPDVTGAFDNENVGTNKTVSFTITEDLVNVTGNEEGYYDVLYPGPGTTTASITPAPVDLTGVTRPQKLESNPKYDGGARELLTAGGVVDGGRWVYSVDGVNFGVNIPKGTDAGGYEVWYKVLADSNHTGTEPVLVEGVKIDPAGREANDLEVLCTPNSFPYDGTEKTPGVTVWDNVLNREVPASEYTVEFPESRTAAGTYSVTVRDRADIGNYEFGASIKGTFSIVEAGQNPFYIVTDKAPAVYYGDTFRLSVSGGSGTGTVTWKSSSEAIATVDDNGVVKVVGTGDFTITATRSGGSNYSESSDSVSFAAEKKPVTPVITAASREYNGETGADLTITWRDGDLAGNDSISISGVSGTFDDENVGTNKTVTINSTGATDGSPNYEITYPKTTTASITPAPTALTGINVTAAANNMKYTGLPQTLVASTGTVTGGSLAYSLGGIDYSLDPPMGKDAGTYKVWYKVRGDSNHTDSEVKWIEVIIGQETPVIKANPAARPITSGQKLKDSVLDGGKAMFGNVELPGTFTWTEDVDEPENGREYDVTFTPMDQVNFTTAKTEVEVEVKAAEDGPVTGNDSLDSPGGGDTNNTGSSTGTTQASRPGTAPSSTATPPASNPGTESASVQTSVRDGAASTVVNTAAVNQLVDEAIANRSGNVVIKPEITGDVTKTEVSIPASAISQISRGTDAVLTVSTPVADVSIPNGSLDTLSGAGGTISVITERTESTVVLTLTANGKEIGDIPGGLTLTVPVEDAGPGTVAVLVHEDGTRETVRKSVMEGDALRIPLNGSVTVEIVDNSREFADVPAESWAAGAVAFASAHEVFNGTSETTFSPELTMSRAMLATVLYNLEGSPDQSPANEFSDVSSDAWYTAGVSWAAVNGITGGYGDGQFGPNDNITREQLVVMLWRCAGRPAADEQTLNFTDVDQASDYAMEALYWAASNDILNGYGNGCLDPCGLATRAQAAQILKNFIENI